MDTRLHTPLFKHGLDSQILTTCSQEFPVVPTGQIHLKPPIKDTHVPP